VDIIVTSDGAGGVNLVVEVSDDCAGLEPVRLVARRGGQTRTAPLRQPDDCRYESAVRLPGRGRWFVYAELRAAGDTVETWLPVRVDRRESHVAHRPLYRPSGGDGITGTEAVTGVAVYLVGIVLLGSALWQVRHRGDRKDDVAEASDGGRDAPR
jgi:hypothetical protein